MKLAGKRVTCNPNIKGCQVKLGYPNNVKIEYPNKITLNYPVSPKLGIAYSNLQ